MVTAVAPLTAHPAFPAIGDPAYNLLAYNWAVFLASTGAPQLLALAQATYDNAVETNGAAGNATSAALLAQAAAAAAGAASIMWVSGTNYNTLDRRASPINFMTYVRKTNGAGTTDPSLDSVNWAPSDRIYIDVNIAVTASTVGLWSRNRLSNVAATAITLPASPAVGDEVMVIPENGLKTNTVLRNGKKIDGIADDVTLDDGDRAGYRFTYIGGNTEWSMEYA